MKKRLKPLKKSNKVNFLFLLGIPLMIMLLAISVGYSALSTALTINGMAHFRPVGMIRVLSLEQNSLLYTTEDNHSFTPDTINVLLDINTYDGYAIYDVNITNLGQIDKELTQVINEIFTNDEMDYEMTGLSIGDVIEAGESVDFQIKFKYKSYITTPLDSRLNAKIKFVFADYQNNNRIAYFKQYDGASDLLGFTNKTDITSFSRNITLTKQEVLAKSGVQKISNESNDQYNSPQDVYGWIENGHFYWWSEADIVYFHPQTLHAFKKIDNLVTVDLTDISTEKVENFAHWFDTDRKLTTITGTIDTSGLKLEYNSSFDYANDSNENTTSDRGLTYLFNDCNALVSVDLSLIDTTNASDLKRMFGGCKALGDIDVSHFNTSNARSMYWMFRNVNAMQELDISNFDTKNVENMSGMFLSSSNLKTITLGADFDTSKVKRMVNMFYNLPKLTTIYAKIDFIRNANLISNNMFQNSTKLIGANNTNYQTNYNSNYRNAQYAQIANEDQPGYFTLYGNSLRIYTITYNLDGGVASNPSFYTEESNTFTLNTPIKTGYDFIGWTGSNGDTPQLSVTVPEGTSGNLTYNANYTKHYYTVVFNANGGIGSMDNQVFEYDEYKSLNTNTFTNNDYQFAGWNTKSDGTGITILDGKVVGNLAESGVVNLYAIWYNPNGTAQLVFNVEGPCSFNGVNNNVTGTGCEAYSNTNTINTGVSLFAQENINKDFRVYFELSNYNNGSQESNQATIFNTFPETSSNNNPGIVLRRANNGLELIVRDANGKGQATFSASDFHSFEIIRKNQKICYTVNGGPTKFIYDFTDTPTIFDTVASLGSSVNGSGNVWRTIRGTLSNMSISLGTLPSSVECDESMR